MENEKRLYEAAQEWSNGDEEGKAIIAKWSPDNEYLLCMRQQRTSIFVRSAEQDSKEASKPVKEKEQKRYDALSRSWDYKNGDL